MPWHSPISATLFAIVAALSDLGCASSEQQLQEGVAGELLPAGEDSPRDEFGISHGEVDTENRYRSVVQIESGMGHCSGVLVDERLVLSAAHCFCAPTSASATVIDKSNCVRSAKVTSVFYQRSGTSKMPVTDDSTGAVIIHAGFRSEVTRRNGKAYVTARFADLAVVRLKEPLKNAVPEGKIRSEEVLLHDEAVVVGFGATGAGLPVSNERRVGRNKVAMLRAIDTLGAREIRFLFPGAHTHEGDSGGPCFREEGGIRWLVGINGGYVASETAPESWFTSTSSYREWIERQIEEARKM
jgi:hypothetical protein